MGRYTIEFKEKAIALAKKSHRSHKEIALGIIPSTFRNWMREANITEKPTCWRVTSLLRNQIKKYDI